MDHPVHCRGMDLLEELHQRPFTRRQGLNAGLTAKQLRSRRYRTVLRGVYLHAGVVVTLLVRARAALLVAPADAVVSHQTAIAVWGLEVPTDGRIHLSTRTGWHSRAPEIVSHRRTSRIAVRTCRGLPVTSPERTFVDLATKLSWPWLVVMGDWLIQQRLTTFDRLVEYASGRHLDGVRRARRALRWVRERSESPRESWVRLLLVMARLPEPECNVEIFDEYGTFVARVDLVYRAWKVAVEYDGDWHERSATQRERDRDRRERLERLGWTMVVIYKTDEREPVKIPWRVFHALRDQGYLGDAPVTSVMWDRWFAKSTMWPRMARSAAA